MLSRRRFLQISAASSGLAITGTDLLTRAAATSFVAACENGFYDHVPPPRVIDDTNPANVMHAGDSTTPTDGQLYPNYKQLGFRVPAIVVSNLALSHQVVHQGPFQHCSSLALIESTFGLTPLTARDRNAQNLGEVLLPSPVPAPFRVPGREAARAAHGFAFDLKSWHRSALSLGALGLDDLTTELALL